MEDFLKELMTKQILQMSIPIMFSANELLVQISEKFSRTPNIRRVISILVHRNIRILIWVDFEERQF